MYDRAQLKEQVKLAMKNTRPRPLWVALLFAVIVSVGSGIINTVVGAISGLGTLQAAFQGMLMSGMPIEDALEQMLWAYGSQLGAVITAIVAGSVLGSLLSWLWSGLMGVGFEGYCLSMIHGEQPSVGKLFCGFPLIGKVLLTRLLVWVFATLWSLLYGVGFVVICLIGALLMNAVPALGVILMVLAWIALMILMVRLNLRYAMADYVLLDQGVYGLEAVTASKVMMKGNKGKLFVLQLSFIGWYLVQFAIVLVGCLLMVLVCVPAMGGLMGGNLSFGALAGMMGGVLAVGLVMTIASLLLVSWLAPYITGSVAKFYEFLRGDRPGEQASAWPPLYGGDSTGSGDVL